MFMTVKGLLDMTLAKTKKVEILNNIRCYVIIDITSHVETLLLVTVERKALELLNWLLQK